MTGPSHEVLRDLHRRMVRIRLFEGRAAGRISEAGRMPGFIHLYVGQEAVAAGACAALRDDDSGQLHASGATAIWWPGAATCLG